MHVFPSNPGEALEGGQCPRATPRVFKLGGRSLASGPAGNGIWLGLGENNSVHYGQGVCL